MVNILEKKLNTDDLRISETKEVIVPDAVHRELPIIESAAKTVLEAREDIHHVLSGEDDRLVVVVGPCSIHDPEAALAYAERLTQIKKMSSILLTTHFNNFS